MSNILVIDDCSEYLDMMCDLLIDAGYYPTPVCCADEAYKELKNDRFDLIICDLELPVYRGPAQKDYQYSVDVGERLIQEFSRLFPTLPVVTVSGELPVTELSRTAELGAIACVPKPFDPSVFLHVVRRSLEVGFVPVVQ